MKTRSVLKVKKSLLAFCAMPWNALFKRLPGLAVFGMNFTEPDKLATALLVARIAA